MGRAILAGLAILVAAAASAQQPSLQGHWQSALPTDPSYVGVVLIDAQHRATLDATWFRDGRMGRAQSLGYARVEGRKAEIVLTNRAAVERMVCAMESPDRMTCHTILSNGRMSVASTMTRVGPGPVSLMPDTR